MPSSEHVIADTRRWLERAVIGLNLCPFAKAVLVKGQVHFAASDAEDVPGLLDALQREVDDLLAQDPSVRDTTLLVVPRMLADFLEFNDFLFVAERLLRRRGLEGVLQLASFHPQYQFAGTDADDVTNCTNRSPYPTLHLLREASVDRAVDAFPEAEAIYENNMRTLRGLGFAGWQKLDVGASR